ncbi:protein FAR1-RELATED SEQUENCE 1 [Citrus clementina]|uniref:protein FAR1-RELATED SEQUENCE 1 n=1 Tax=Citrus clementina TaxID=85681 RepID=UPI000CECED90|nr:protein FAR1-RELATED SEQUENCE 1 [Citrus x clementina]
MQNALKHVNGVFKGTSTMKSVLSVFMDSIEDENEFLVAWDNVLDEYDVHGNIWLKRIFELRHKWVYAYVSQAWSAGMKSTQLSESFNAILKDYLKSNLNMPQFFMHFERMVNDKWHKKLEAEYELCYKLVNMKMSVKMLAHAREIYTKVIFQEFQDQFEKSINLFVKKDSRDGEYLVCTVGMDDFEKGCVKIENDGTLACSYKRFEMRGVLCSHIINVLRDVIDVKEIPIGYILKGWTKQARAECIKDMYRREIQADPKLEQTCRYRSLCSIFTKISSWASESKKAYKLANAHAMDLARLI